MSIQHFLASAKSGLLHPPEVQEGSFKSFNMLGSGNAISATGSVDLLPNGQSQTKFIAPDGQSVQTKFIAPDGQSVQTKFIAPSQKKIISDEERFAYLVAKKVLDLMKIPESKTHISKDAIFDKAVEPKNSPPFLLPKEQEDELIYINYLKQVDDKQGILFLKKDDKNFTKIVELVHNINKQITDYNRDSTKRFSDMIYNSVVKFGDFVIDIFGDIAKFYGRGAVNEPIDKIKDIIKHLKPSNTTDYVGSLNKIKEALFEGHPEWKRKYNEISENQFMQMISDLGLTGDPLQDIFNM